MKFFVKLLRDAVALLMRMYVLPKLWLWFAVPLGAPVLGWPHLFGLAVLSHFFTGVRPDYMDGASEDDKEIREWTMSLGLPPLSLLFGWMWHSFM